MSSAEVSVNGQSGPHAAAPGRGVRVTVPMTTGPEKAARDLAPRLRALAGEAAPASSQRVGTNAGAERAHQGAPASSMVTIRVADDGPGIPAEIRDRVFDRFVRGDSSRTRDGRGSSGLGMSIVESLARAMGGSVRLVDSEKGTVIEVMLPAA